MGTERAADLAALALAMPTDDGRGLEDSGAMEPDVFSSTVMRVVAAKEPLECKGKSLTHGVGNALVGHLSAGNRSVLIVDGYLLRIDS